MATTEPEMGTTMMRVTDELLVYQNDLLQF